ncbi:MAG: glycosyltransferase family 4 protein [Cyclobacteriaceae bacterium]
MNIGMLLDNEFTGDMRVENEVASLTRAGFGVFVLCINHGDKPEIEKYQGGTIVRIKLSKFQKNKMKGLANTAFDIHTWYWGRKLKWFARKYAIDIFHIHDLYMVGAAFAANKLMKRKLPVISDLHENYPQAIRHYSFTKTFPGNLLVSIPKWDKTEVDWVKKSDHVITVIEEAKSRYVSLGVDPQRITVVANYVYRDHFLTEKNDAPSATHLKYKNNFVLFYAGGFDIHRGLESVIRAIPEMISKIPELKVVLVGTGRNHRELEELAGELKVSDYVAFEGWQQPDTLPDYIKASDVCMIPHIKTAHTDNTIPHKLFQYMLLKKPVLSSNCDPLTRIIEDTNCGVIYQSDDENDLADKVLTLYANDSMRSDMGEKGKSAVESTYNWENTAENLIELYKHYQKSLQKH